MVRVEILDLFLILKEMLSAFHSWVWFICSFVICGLYYVEGWSLYAHFLERFLENHKWMLNFVKGFFCIYWDGHMVLQFVDVVYHTDWFVHIEKSLHPWDESKLIMVYDPFNVALFILYIVVCTFNFPLHLALNSLI